MRLLIVVIVILGISACKDASNNNSVKTGIIFHKAVNYYHTGNYTKSLKLFEQATLISPDNPDTYLYAALICDSALSKPLKAKHYYLRFLELSKNSEKKALVQSWIGNTTVSSDKSELTAALKKSTELSAKVAKLKHTVNKQARHISKLQATIKTANLKLHNLEIDRQQKESKLIELKQQMNKAQNELKNTQQLHGIIYTDSSDNNYKSNIEPDQPILNTTDSPPPFNTYFVKEGDTLPDIAKKTYNDSTLWKILWNANKFQLEDTAPRPGQILVIPPKPIEPSRLSN